MKDMTWAGRFEAEIDKLADLAKRRPWLLAIIVVLLLGACAIIFYDKFYGIPTLKEENQMLRSDRDSAREQLAPFLAVADKSFPSAPQDKRLVMLVDKMETAVRSLQEAAQKISKDRRIPSDIASTAVSQLKSYGNNSSIMINYKANDGEAFELANQFKHVFLKAGWKTKSHAVVSAIPLKGVAFISGTFPSEHLVRSVFPLFKSIGYEKFVQIDPTMEANKYAIDVGYK